MIHFANLQNTDCLLNFIKISLLTATAASIYPQGMGTDNFKIAEECFREARIQRASPALDQKYGSSIKNRQALFYPKNLTGLNNRDFDQHSQNERARRQ